MSEHSCPVCGHRRLTLMTASARENIPRSKTRYAYWGCNSCDVISLVPQPTADDLSDHYAWLDRKSVTPSKHGSMAPARRKSILYRLWHNINDPYPYLKKLPRGNIVDLGAGSGDFCVAAQQLGYQAVGIEQSVRSAALAKQKGAHVDIANVNSPSQLPRIRNAAIITMNHVFEHLAHPERFLAEMSAVVPRSSLLVITLPNPTNPWRMLFGGSWHGWDPPVHLHLYPARALKRMLLRNGFQIELIRTKARPDGMTRSITHALGTRPRRYLWLRVLLLPLLPMLETFGLGDELIVIARAEDARATRATV
jgi:2-polyprenyl-3-methyl-5-hydroxy-6-metoxy-1,4-benzoquinol methylase